MRAGRVCLRPDLFVLPTCGRGQAGDLKHLYLAVWARLKAWRRSCFSSKPATALETRQPLGAISLLIRGPSAPGTWGSLPCLSASDEQPGRAVSVRVSLLPAACLPVRGAGLVPGLQGKLKV